MDLDAGGPPLTGVADGDGTLTLTRVLDVGSCDLHVQALDGTSCAVSEVVTLP